MHVQSPSILEDPRRGPPIIVLGASAGGLSAVREVVAGIPAEAGVAVLLLQHRAPAPHSRLPEVLDKATPLDTKLAEDGETLRAGVLYVTPPGVTPRIDADILRLEEGEGAKGFPIDRVLLSLAASRQERAVAIILSGTGSDGTRGAVAVKEVGGVVAVQDPSTAEYASMPRNVIEATAADIVLPPDRIAARVLAYLAQLPDSSVLAPDDVWVDRLLVLIHERSGQDFSGYKRSTLLRRIRRRMGLAHATSLEGYFHLAEEDPEEAERLRRDLLIPVTRFFRDRDAWRALEQEVRELVSGMEPGRPIRAWSAGCSTGEEAWSLAILLAEVAAGQHPVQVFATDIDRFALEVARRGFYSEPSLQDLPASRRARWFTSEGDGWQVRQSLRDLVMFVPHDLLADPPFSRLDMVSCRNVLIYLNTDTQARILDLMRFALQPGGLLFLGKAESLVGQETGWTDISSRERIYARSDQDRGAAWSRSSNVRRWVERKAPKEAGLASGAIDSARRILLEQLTPPAVVVDAENRVIYFHGHTSPYLRQPQGEPTRDILSLADVALRGAIRSALVAVRESGHPSEVHAQVQEAEGRSHVSVVGRLLGEGPGGQSPVLLVFEPVKSVEPQEGASPANDATLRLLEEELQVTRRELESTIGELEAINEELRSSNEEVMSVNEELQSTNEEMETSKEELQSLNEELTTVNAELEAKVDELEGANRHLDNLYASTQVAAVFLDAELSISQFTPAATTIFHLRDGDVGRPLADITQRVRDPDLLMDCRAVMNDHEAREAEVVGGERWLIRRVLPYKGQRDHVAGVVVTYTDITANKLAQEALRLSEERFRTVLAASPITVMSRDLEGRYLWVYNPQASRNRSIIGLTDLEAFGEQGQAAADMHREAVATRKGQRREVTLDTPSGRATFDLMVEPTFGADGQVTGSTGTGIDITERKKEQQEAARLAALVASSADAILSKTLDGFITSWNRAAEQLYGWTAEEAINRHIDLIIPSRLREEGAEILERLRRGEGSVLEETTRRTKDGREVSVSLSASPIRDLHGRVVAASVIARDITRELESRRRLEDQARRLAEADRAKNEFLAMLGHELRNPLAALATSLRLLEDARDRHERMPTRPMEMMRRQLDQLSRLVDDLLDVARITQGKIKLHRQTMDLQTVIGPAVEATEAYFQARRVRLSLDPWHEPLPVHGDLQRLEQVLNNLLTNAAKYSPAGAEVRLAAYLEGDEAVLEVIDEGVGIDPARVDEVFDLFVQADTTPDRTDGGLGLGLPLVRRVVEMHGGTVDAFSEGRGRGSRFSVRLPLASEPVEAIEAPRPKPSRAQRVPEPAGRRVLLVDDNPDVLEALSELLESYGHQVETRANGPTALDRARTFRPDVVVLDLGLPGLDGYEVARRMREGLGLTSRLIALSGYGQEEDRRRSEASGFDHHLLKPPDVDRLRELIESAPVI